MSTLEQRFDASMMDIYGRAKAEVGYNGTRYFQMLINHRGRETARILLYSPNVSDGYTAMWQHGRLDLTVEALIHDNSEYHQLFDEDELRIARDRLRSYGYAAAISEG